VYAGKIERMLLEAGAGHSKDIGVFGDARRVRGRLPNRRVSRFFYEAQWLQGPLQGG
jgi:hypothetical protein